MLHGTSSADAEWESYLDEGWDRETAAAVGSRFPELVLQQQSEQRPHKVSYKLFAADPAQASGVVSNLRSSLTAAGLDVNVVFSGGQDLDILPARASKGKALSFLLKQLEEGAAGGNGPERVLVAGDSGNDIDLFAVPGVDGCMVANAHPELKEWCESMVGEDKSKHIFAASSDGPGGIVEALYHFGHLPAENIGDTAKPPNLQSPDTTCTGRRHAVIELHQWFEDWFNKTANQMNEDNGIDKLASLLSPTFELIGPSGMVTPRRSLLAWFRHKASLGIQNVGSEGVSNPGLLAAAMSEDFNGKGPRVDIPTSIAMAPNVGLGSSSSGGGGSGGGHEQTGEEIGACSGGAFRIWIDDFSEREIGQGIWIVRYMEYQQRFPVLSGSSSTRTGRCCSAILREMATDNDAKYIWEHIHETWVAELSSVGDQ